MGTGKRKMPIFGAGLAGLAVCTTLAAEPDFADGLLDRAAALEAAAAVTTNRYPDAEEVLVAGIRRMDYEPDGTFTSWHEEFVKVLTEEGRRRLLTLSSYFTIPYQRGPEDCRITRVEIVKPDGGAVPVDVARQSRIMVDPGGMSANIYNPNEKLIQVNIPALAAGDVLHFVMFDRIVQPRMPDAWCEWFVLEGTRPILSETIEIHAPAERPLRSIALRDEVPGTVRADHRRTEHGMVYRWDVREVPRMFPEPDMPPLHTVVQRLLVSTAPDWQAVSRWYWRISEPHYAHTPAMAEQAAALTRGPGTERERMEAVFRFVAQDVRYMGITVEAAAPGYEPHDVKDTFEAKHGVCRDKAALLVVMLRLAGFEAFPVLIDTGSKKDPEVAQPYFNHAIVAVRGGDGEYLLMDPTSETVREFLPAYLNDKSYLVATPAGDPLRTSPTSPAEHNLVRIRTEGALETGGGLSAEADFFFEGINDLAYRSYFARCTAEERRRFFEGLVKAAVPGARLTGIEFRPQDMTDLATPLGVRVRFAAPDVPVRGKDFVMLPLPFAGGHVGVANRIVESAGLASRRYPFFTEVACGVQERLTLALPPGLETPLALPAPSRIETNGLRWSLEVRQRERVLEAEADFRLTAVQYSPAEYRQLKETLKTAERARRAQPLYAVPEAADGEAAAAPDAVVLDEDVEYVLSDAHAWTEKRTVRKQILTYAGKKEHAELKIAYNTAWETVRLDRAVVTDRDGVAREIRPQEINVMDAPWVGAAGRYPPQRILVASLPAVEVGSVIAYEFTRACRARPFFARQEYFRSFDALGRKRVRVDAPAGLKLHVQTAGWEGWSIESSRREAPDGRQALEWEARAMPAMRREEDLPPAWACRPTLFVGAGTWRDYAPQVEAILREAAAGQPLAEQAARELLGPDPWQTARAIRDAVALRVREAGPGLHELPLNTISPADRTLSDGYGHSADRAVLLYAMLQAAGFKPRFVLASAEPLAAALGDAIARMPDPRLFGQALVVLEPGSLGLPEGGAVYLNDTDQYAALGAAAHEGHCALALPTGRLEEIRPAREGGTAVEYELTLDANGDTEIRKRMLFHGTAFGREHLRFAEFTPEERRRHYQEMTAALSQGAEAAGALVTDFSGYPGRVEFAVRVPGFAVREADYLYVRLPELLEGFLDLRSDARVHPLYLADGVRQSVRAEIRRPNGFSLAYWPPFVQESGVGRAGLAARLQVELRAAETSSVVVVEGRAVRQPCIVEAERYPELLRLDQSLEHAGSRTVVFRQVPEEGGTSDVLSADCQGPE